MAIPISYLKASLIPTIMFLIIGQVVGFAGLSMGMIPYPFNFILGIIEVITFTVTGILVVWTLAGLIHG
jgi:hypothetical protein